jgi:hypothetical protein
VSEESVSFRVNIHFNCDFITLIRAFKNNSLLTASVSFFTSHNSQLIYKLRSICVFSQTFNMKRIVLNLFK